MSPVLTPGCPLCGNYPTLLMARGRRAICANPDCDLWEWNPLERFGGRRDLVLLALDRLSHRAVAQPEQAAQDHGSQDEALEAPPGFQAQADVSPPWEEWDTRSSVRPPVGLSAQQIADKMRDQSDDQRPDVPPGAEVPGEPGKHRG